MVMGNKWQEGYFGNLRRNCGKTPKIEKDLIPSSYSPSSLSPSFSVVKDVAQPVKVFYLDCTAIQSSRTSGNARALTFLLRHLACCIF